MRISRWRFNWSVPVAGALLAAPVVLCPQGTVRTLAALIEWIETGRLSALVATSNALTLVF